MDFVTQNIFWVAIAFISGGMLLAPLLRSSAGRFGISPVDAVTLINREDATVIDLRDNEAFIKGHIPESRNIPLDQFDKRVGEIARLKKKPVILVCESGIRAAKTSETLRQQSFERPLVIAGGFAAWAQSGQPVVKVRK